MKRLSDIKGEEALDVLADLIEPASIIMADSELANMIRSGASRMQIAKKIMKGHKREIITIFAILESEDPEMYQPTLPEIPAKIISILNDPAFVPFFQSQGQNPEEASSGSATENTEATGKE